MRLFIAILAMLVSPVAQEPTAELDAVVDEASEAAIEAADGASGPADLDKAEARGVAEIDATMRLVSIDPELGQRLPLPAYVTSGRIEAALAHDAAWSDGARDDGLIMPLMQLADATGHAIYYEWACSTGGEEATPQPFFQLLDQMLTTYPQRLLLKRAIESRDIMGYGTDRDCSAVDLERSRRQLLDAQVAAGAVPSLEVHADD